MRSAALLLVLAACGRIDFAERAQDASAIGHDEDGDGIPDAMDPCPHVAMGGTTDTDGDGVGDACDINPTTPTEHWLAFYTMQPGDNPFDDLTGLDQEPDALHVSSTAQPGIVINLVDARIDMGWDVHATVGTAQHQIAFGLNQPSSVPEYYFAELDDNGMGAQYASITQYDGSTGYTQLDTMDPGPFHAGAGLTRLDTGTTHHLLTGWTGQMYMLTAATPAYVGGDKIRCAFNGIDASINYVAIIGTSSGP